MIERGASQRNTASDPQLWLHRKVQGESLTQLTQATRLFNRKEAKRKFGDFTTSLLYPADIYVALERSTNRHSLTASQVYDIVLEELPESTLQSTSALTRSIWQYGSSIGVELDIPEFDEERLAIETALRSILGIRYIRKVNPHVSLAKGTLSHVTNIKEIEYALPLEMDLSPVSSSLSPKHKAYGKLRR